MLALFLGAGFSRWAADLPIASELFDFHIEPWGPRDNHKIDIVRSRKESWDKAHPDGLTEEFIADALDFPKKDKEAVLWYVVRRLSEPFIWNECHAQRRRRHVLMIDENRRFDIEGVVEARDFLQPFYGPLLVGTITTNYDMLVEYALGTKGFNYGVRNQRLIGRGPYPVSQWRNLVRLKGEIPLAKIHGSISWDERGSYTDGRRAVTGGALIVPPTPEKEPPGSLKHVWRLAARILERATALVVFGFAFNPYDEAVLSLLQYSGRNLESVVVIDIEPKIEQARQVWPTATIIPCRPPPEGTPKLRSWRRRTGRAMQRPVRRWSEEV